MIALFVGACGSPSGQASQSAPPAQATPTNGPTAMPSTNPQPTSSASPTPSTNVLDIPMDYQDHPLSCEAAALKMALTKEGIQASEDELLALMGRDDRAAVVDSNGRLLHWGNPNVAYVGDPDGKLASFTGYGVYAAPVAKAAAAAGATVLVWGTNLPPDRGKGIAPATVYQALLEGHPVVAWISNTYHDIQLGSYTAFDGTTIWYTLTEHAVTLIGVRPDAVLINDPWFGQAWHSKAEFESAFHTFEEMAVIVE
ncbi:MAG TPA: C39 family peptidase [Candidatus Dormibacteraeota bacterium]|nr:C39 family peptidase [Candidatus Dormibacteraeota bacterium]